MPVRKLDVAVHNDTIFNIKKKKRFQTEIAFFCVRKFYFPLFTFSMYFSKAIVIEGVSGVGAAISTRKSVLTQQL